MSVFVVTVLLFIRGVLCSSELNPCVVKLGDTSHGVGLLNQTFSNVSFCAFLGVRYAEPPVGPLRFMNPVLLKPNGFQNNTAHGNICTQLDNVNDPTDVIGDEDCLFLDIFTPAVSNEPESRDLHKYPVLVFVHGGTFIVGSSMSDVEYGVDSLINNGILVVSINYRLATFGFLQYAPFNITGNMGLKDQRTALQWIQKYIKFYGGDPQRVTLMGHSAGSGSVTHHLYAESSVGLFQRLFAVGGSFLSPWALNYDQSPYVSRLIEKLNASTLEDLQSINYKNLSYLGHEEIFGCFSMFYSPYIPTLESNASSDPFITIPPQQLVLKKPASQVPTMISHTALEFESLIYYDLMYVGNNFPNNDDSIRKNISRLASLEASIFNDELFYKKLSNVANMYYPIKRLLRHLTEHFDGTPIYYLNFDYDGRFGYYKNHFYKELNSETKYGAIHGDELGYIFSPYIAAEATADRNEYRNEWKVHERTVELLANFVHYGDPTPKRSKLSGVLWPAYNGDASSRRFLNIDEVIDVREENDSANEYVALWEPIYECIYYYQCKAFEKVIEGVIASSNITNWNLDNFDENMMIIGDYA